MRDDKNSKMGGVSKKELDERLRRLVEGSQEQQFLYFESLVPDLTKMIELRTKSLIAGQDWLLIDARDYIALVLLKVWKHRADSKFQERPVMWFYRTLKNEHITNVRRINSKCPWVREGTGEMDIESGSLAIFTPSESFSKENEGLGTRPPATPSRQALGNEAEQKVLLWLREYPNQKDAGYFKAMELDDERAKDVAERCGVTPNEVSIGKHRVKKYLQERYLEEGGFEG
jgi:DNA-directed RNA polymerase specialized sigma24 family protein